MNRTRGFPLTIDEDCSYQIPNIIYHEQYSMNTFSMYSYGFGIFFHSKYFVCHTFNPLGDIVVTRSRMVFTVIFLMAVNPTGQVRSFRPTSKDFTCLNQIEVITCLARIGRLFF